MSNRKQAQDDGNIDKTIKSLGDRQVGVPISKKPSHQGSECKRSELSGKRRGCAGELTQQSEVKADENSPQTSRNSGSEGVSIVENEVFIDGNTRSKAASEAQRTAHVKEKLGSYCALMPWLPRKIQDWRGQWLVRMVNSPAIELLAQGRKPLEIMPTGEGDVGMPGIYSRGRLPRNWHT